MATKVSYMHMPPLILTMVCTMNLFICFSQDNKNPLIQKGSKEQGILDLEVRRLAAFASADSNAFKNMVTEDLIIVHGSGTMMNRAEEISVMRPSTPEHPLPKLSIENAKVNFYDKAAIMRGNLVETAADGRRELVLRFTNTYIKQNDQWRLAASQLNTLSRERAVIKIDTLIYKAYAGQYKSSVPGKTASIINENGKLLIESGGRKFELFPNTESQFFIKEADVLITFIRNNKGEVIAFANRQPNGDVSESIKIN